jgi:ComF family protein
MPFLLRPRSWPQRVSAAWIGALPTLCAVCHIGSPHAVCAPCLARYRDAAPRCIRCGLRLPSTHFGACQACTAQQVAQPSPSLAGVLVAVDYAFPWNRLITRFKDHDALDLATPLVNLMVDSTQTPTGSSMSPAPGRPAWIVPVPASRERLRARGYNPAWELARRVARRLSMPTQPALLHRLTDTSTQRGLDRDARAANVRGVFAVNPNRGLALRDQHVVLIDDVMTTGATLIEAARTLRHAGAASVHAWVCARTPDAPEARRAPPAIQSAAVHPHFEASDVPHRLG